MSLSRAFLALLKKEFILAFRNPSDLINPLLFFMMVMILFPFGVGSDTKLLADISVGIVWVTVLLAIMLSLDNLFKADFLDGTLEELVLSPHSTAFLVLVKVLANWLMTCLPLVIISPVMALMMGLQSESVGVLVLSLLAGTPVLLMVGAIGAALTVGLRNGGVILSLLVLPLYIPVVIFGAGMVTTQLAGLPYLGQIYMLLSFLALALVLAPFAIAASLKLSLS
jgi:heme exporter protein B